MRKERRIIKEIKQASGIKKLRSKEFENLLGINYANFHYQLSVGKLGMDVIMRCIAITGKSFEELFCDYREYLIKKEDQTRRRAGAAVRPVPGKEEKIKNLLSGF